MPGSRSGSKRHLEAALGALTRALNASGAPWMVIGGIAIIARGVRRFTTDIDVAVRGDAVRVASLVRTLHRYGIRPRIDDAIGFAEENLVLLLRHTATGVDLDVSLAWSGFEHDALDRRTPTQFGRVRAPMCIPPDLVVFKAIAARPRDIEDAEALLVLYPDIDVASVRKRVAELAMMAEAPEILTAFDLLRTKATNASGKTTRSGRISEPRTRKSRVKRRPG